MKTALSIMAIVLLVCSPNLWEVEAISGGIPNIGEMTFNEVTKNLAKLDIGSAVQQDTATILAYFVNNIKYIFQVISPKLPM